MDIIARIKSNINKLQTSGTEQNLVFASRLEKYVLIYTNSNLESQREDSYITGITNDFIEPLKEVDDISKSKIHLVKSSSTQSLINCKKVSRNIQAFNSRNIGFDLWAEFEDKDSEPIVEGQESKGKETEAIAATTLLENDDLVIKKETLADHVESQPFSILSVNNKIKDDIFKFEDCKTKLSRMEGAEETEYKQSETKDLKDFGCEINEDNLLTNSLVLERNSIAPFSINMKKEKGNSYFEMEEKEKIPVVADGHILKDDAKDSMGSLIDSWGKDYKRNPSIEDNRISDKSDKDVNKIIQTDSISLTVNGLSCRLCPYKVPHSKTRGALKRHMNRYHFVCCVCEASYESKEELASHFASKHQQLEEYLSCNIDGCLYKTQFTKTASNKISFAMKTHIRSIHRGVWFYCDQCDMKKSVEFELERHKIRQHSLIPRPRHTIDCDVCGLTVSITSITQHMKKIHGNRPIIFCSQCEFSNNDPSYMKTHEQGHVTPYNCQKCEFTCKTQKYIKQHTLEKHEGEALLCYSCEFRAGSLSKLRNHEEQHNERSLKCPNCDYMGKGKNRLSAHMKRHKDPKYICRMCDYKTSDQSNFNTHTTVKHGDVILKCNICDYTTKSKRSLNQHSEKHSKSL